MTKEIKTINGLAPFAELGKIRDGKFIEDEEAIQEWNDVIEKNESKK